MTAKQIQQQALAIIERMGLTHEQALAIFYRQIVEFNTFPFKIDEQEKAQFVFQSQANRAWQHYQQSGLHATHADVELWVERLYSTSERVLTCRK